MFVSFCPKLNHDRCGIFLNEKRFKKKSSMKNPIVCEKLQDSYENCLPDSFKSDQGAPPAFSFSWLQRIGRVDIMNQELSNETKDLIDKKKRKTERGDPRFKLTVRIKKTKRKENEFPIVLGMEKEQRMLSLGSLSKKKSNTNISLVNFKARSDSKPIHDSYNKEPADKFSITVKNELIFSDSSKLILALVLTVWLFFQRLSG